MLVGQVASLLVGQWQRDTPLRFIQRAGRAIHHDAQIVEPGQPDVPFGGKAGLGCAVFALAIIAPGFFKGATPQHFQQIAASQCRVLRPEQTALAVAVAEDGRFQFFGGKGITEFALIFKQCFQLVAEQDAGECFAVVALLVALCFREFGQHHLGGAAVVFFLHQFLRARQPLLDLTAFTFAVTFRRLFFGAADPVEAAMLAQVIDHARPFFGVQLAVKCIYAQLPG